MATQTILIVDDEFSIVETLTDILSWEGYGVVSAPHGEGALKMIEGGARPSLILLDFMMPVMDGMQTLRAVRAHGHLATIPIIMMTAAPLGLPAQERNWDALLIKPFDAQQLMRAIRQLLPADSGSDER